MQKNTKVYGYIWYVWATIFGIISPISISIIMYNYFDRLTDRMGIVELERWENSIYAAVVLIFLLSAFIIFKYFKSVFTKIDLMQRMKSISIKRTIVIILSPFKLIPMMLSSIKSKSRYLSTAIIIKMLVGLVVLLWLLNPSYTRFKEYADLPDTKNNAVIRKKISNWLIFSTYEIGYYNKRFSIKQEEEYILKGRYIGFFLNFFEYH